MIRKLEKANYEESLQLSEYAFQYKVPQEQRENRFEKLKEQSIFGIFDQGILAAKFHLIPLEVWMGEQKYSMGGIAGVATYPEFRRRGHVRNLMNFSLEQMKKENQVISMLHPFSIDFYRKFGWEVFSFFEKVYLKKKDLTPLNKTEGCIRRYSKDNYPVELETIYERYAVKQNGMLVRTKSWWKERSITDLFIAIYYDELSEPTGYITYEVKKERLKVEEFIALNSEARFGLWNYICQHDSMVEDVELILNPIEVLPFMLKDPKVKIEKQPYFMVRIVDVESFLKIYLKQISNSTHFSLRISDANASWNNETFMIKGQDVVVTGKEPCELSIEMTINALSSLVFGVHTPQSLIDMGQLITNNQEAVNQLKIFSQQNNPFFYDFF
ncbi:GNAT family N-acetyltransferase [Rossellomorea aquimaris]|uniref:GNAT family N-acetyltransferase n=1 Tax=Rossellomorea aquimaris TaxID=189382 RepID=UPI0007D04B16|nr:GNAT family N-acetyltransferase [Rossellomorea aquimaris]